MPKYAVTIVYRGEAVVEIDADSHLQAEHQALANAGIDQATYTFKPNRLDDRTGTHTGRAAETVRIAGREVRMELQTTYSKETQ